ncbi:MAG: hypothetical protein AB1563_04670 [Bacillota bacterium]
MRKEDWERKARELQLDHVAAGGFISQDKAERIIEEVYGPEPCEDMELPSSDNR